MLRTRTLLSGTTDLDMPQKAGAHADKDKFNVFAVDLTSMTLLGSIYAVLDLANTNSTAFHEFCLKPCPIYGFGNDFKAHVMAVKVCEEADFWARAVADPKVAFPLLSSFLGRAVKRQGVDLMNTDARAKLRTSMAAAVKAGKEKKKLGSKASSTRSKEKVKARAGAGTVASKATSRPSAQTHRRREKGRRLQGER